MLLRPEQLGSHLAKGIASIYVVTGEEPLLALEAADAIRAAVKAAGYTDRKIYSVERGFDWGQLRAASAGMSLFGDKTFIDLRIPGGKPGKEGAKALEQHAQEASPEATTLITLPKLERTTEKSAWFTALTSQAVDAQGNLAVDFTCDGTSASPPLEWQGVPEGTKSFALCMWHIAPDKEKSYWILYNIPAHVTKLAKNSQKIGTLGPNDKKRADYDPPCSKGPGLKEYHITLYALSAELKLKPAEASLAAVRKAVEKPTLAEGTLNFSYERKK